jgi:uncharacterized membrane protein YjfL (UPF0719 family)
MDFATLPTKFVEVILWTVFATVLFYGAIRLFDQIDRINYQEEIQRGNVAAGIQLAALTLALAGLIIAVIVSP